MKSATIKISELYTSLLNESSHDSLVDLIDNFDMYYEFSDDMGSYRRATAEKDKIHSLLVNFSDEDKQLLQSKISERGSDVIDRYFFEFFTTPEEEQLEEKSYSNNLSEAKEDESEEDSSDDVVDEVQLSLQKALKGAKQLGDEKLVTQIGNTITFFTRVHIVGDAEEDAEEVFAESIYGLKNRLQKTAGISSNK
jgi:hypothetical protein